MLMKLTAGQSSISLRLSGSGYLPPYSLFTGRHAVVGTVHVKFTKITKPKLSTQKGCKKIILYEKV